MSAVASEKSDGAALYERAWSHDEYREWSPGESTVMQFIQVAEPQMGQTLRDLGCGTGRAGLALSKKGLDVTLVDFAPNCRDAEARELPFLLHDLIRPLDGYTDYAFCTDVMEHVAPEDVEKVLTNVCHAGRRVFLSICCLRDDLGHKLIGEPLHLTVKPLAWWKEQIEAIGCEVLWERDLNNGEWAQFYVTAYANAMDFIKKSVVNYPEESIRANIRANLAAKYEELRPYMPHDSDTILLAGGPSLNDFEDDIRAKRAAGMRLVTVNGTYNWCLERGITPSVQIVCDARPFNIRFVQPSVEKCRYLIASQCDPSLAASLPRDQVVLWHSGDSYEEEQTAAGLEKWKDWFPVLGGGTVVLRAIPLLLLLGFNRLHIYGLDSCLRDGAHHAYSQPENDKALTVTVHAGKKTFTCHPWQVCQAQDFQALVRALGNAMQMEVYGDGLIRHILETAGADAPQN